MSAAAVLGHTAAAAVLIAALVVLVALAERQVAVRLGSVDDPPGTQRLLAPFRHARTALADADPVARASLLSELRGWVPAAVAAGALTLLPLDRALVAADAAQGSAIVVVALALILPAVAELAAPIKPGHHAPATGAVTRSAGVLVTLAAAVLSFAVLAGSASLTDQVALWRGWWLLAQAPAALLVIVCGLAVLRRAPLDELLGAAPVTGSRLVQLRAAQYTGLLLIAGLLATVYLGGWHGPFSGAVGWLWTLVKTVLVAALLIAMRQGLSRSRLRPLTGRVWSVLVPLGLAQLLLSGVVATLTRGGAA